jgi:hypothetical protein
MACKEKDHFMVILFLAIFFAGRTGPGYRSSRYQIKKPARLRLVGFVNLFGFFSNRMHEDFKTILQLKYLIIK